MKAVPLTPEVASAIIEKMQEYYNQKHRSVSGWVRKVDGFTWEASSEICYAPCATYLRGDDGYPKNHPDHFGIVYQGYSKGGITIQNVTCEEALQWMEHLVNPDGMFKDILPHLYHTDAKQIIEDRGVVVQDALKANAGLLWTFIQATRLMYECPSQMKTFQEALKHDPQMAAFMAMCIMPVDVNAKTWTSWSGNHCAPLGGHGVALAHNVLNGKAERRDVHCTGGSYRCFGSSDMPANYYREYKNYPRPFEAWVDQFNRMKKDKNVKVTAYEQ